MLQSVNEVRLALGPERDLLPRAALLTPNLPEAEAIANEFRHGLATLRSGETVAGATRFAQGRGRHGEF